MMLIGYFSLLNSAIFCIAALTIWSGELAILCTRSLEARAHQSPLLHTRPMALRMLVSPDLRHLAYLVLIFQSTDHLILYHCELHFQIVAMITFGRIYKFERGEINAGLEVSLEPRVIPRLIFRRHEHNVIHVPARTKLRLREPPARRARPPPAGPTGDGDGPTPRPPRAEAPTQGPPSGACDAPPSGTSRPALRHFDFSHFLTRNSYTHSYLA